MPKKKKGKLTTMGDVQAQIGRTSSMMGVFRAYIFLVFSLIVGIALISYGFSVKNEDSQEEWILIGFGIVLIAAGIGAVIMSRFINRKVNSNRKVAQGYATLSEVGFISGIFSPFSYSSYQTT